MLFELEGVTLSRDGKLVLRDLSVSLPEGASCVAGPSGCGKSTLLRLLNRLADPDSGAVHYEGADVRERDPLELRREVCLVPQLPALLEGTVADNLRFAARTSPGAIPTSRGCSISPASTERSPRAPPPAFGRRAAAAMLARALALEPRVLLLDEPTSALDEDARGAVEATLLHLRDASASRTSSSRTTSIRPADGRLVRAAPRGRPRAASRADGRCS